MCPSGVGNEVCAVEVEGHRENDSNNKVNSLQRLDIEITNIFFYFLKHHYRRRDSPKQ